MTRWNDEHNFLLPPPAGQEGIGQFIDDRQMQLDGSVQAHGITGSRN